jgi:hypothetical protein
VPKLERKNELESAGIDQWERNLEKKKLGKEIDN